MTVNLAESPLGWLRSRGHVGERQFAAGEQLRSDWERSGLPPRVTMCWESPPPKRTPRGPAGPASATHAQLAARRRFAALAEGANRSLDTIALRRSFRSTQPVLTSGSNTPSACPRSMSSITGPSDGAGPSRPSSTRGSPNRNSSR